VLHAMGFAMLLDLKYVFLSLFYFVLHNVALTFYFSSTLKSKDAMKRVFVVSALHLILLTLLKIFGIKLSFLQPFTLGIVTMGSVTYFLACLIMSSRYYHSGRSTEYIGFQVLMITSLLLALGTSSVWSINAMFYTACTFATLYTFEKVVEIPSIWSGPGLWFGILGISVLLYYGSFFLHNNPQYIVGMFDTSYFV